MVLIPCSECGEQVSTKAAACPNCGAPPDTPEPPAPEPEAEPGPDPRVRNPMCNHCGRTWPSNVDALDRRGMMLRCPHCNAFSLAFGISELQPPGVSRTARRSTVGGIDEERRAGRVGLGCAVAGVVGLVFAAMCFAGGGGSGGDSEPSFVSGYTSCTRMVREQLRSPSTADFPLLDYEVRGPASDGSYWIRSHVDAQNAFGAEIRNDWICTITGSGSTWRATSAFLITR